MWPNNDPSDKEKYAGGKRKFWQRYLIIYKKQMEEKSFWLPLPSFLLVLNVDKMPEAPVITCDHKEKDEKPTY